MMLLRVAFEHCNAR